MYVLSKNKKNIKKILLKILIFYNFKNLCILHGKVFVMAIGPADRKSSGSNEEGISCPQARNI